VTVLPADTSAEPGLLLIVNGHERRIRALSLVTGPGKLPIWLADVDGHLGGAATIESALLHAVQACDATQVTRRTEES
jgi:hypothetical protein